MMLKFIHWRDNEGDLMGKPDEQGRIWANVHLLVGYNQKSITDYQKMADEMRKTFPFMKDRDLYCGTVTESTYCKNFSLLAWNGYLEKKDYEGWRSTQGMDYYWC